MWPILEIIVLAAIALIFVTEFFIPIITGKPLFGSFRKTQETNEAKPKKPSPEAPLKEKVHKAKEKVEEVVEEVKEVQGEVAQNFKSAKDLKKEADDLLK